MKRIKEIIPIFCIVIIGCKFMIAKATILPENLPIFDGEQEFKIDHNLDKWFQIYTSEKTFTKIEHINGLFNNEDKISAYYALILNPELTKNNNMVPNYKEIELDLALYFDENNKYHPLHDYILSLISNSELYSNKDRKKAATF